MNEQMEMGGESQHYIDRRLDEADQLLFWHYLISGALRLSLYLLCENVDKPIGLIWPLKKKKLADFVTHGPNLSTVGESLISWLRANGASYTFFSPAPLFEYGDDYRVFPFDLGAEEDMLVVVPRQVESLSYTTEAQETVHRLLTSLREYTRDWHFIFNQHICNVVNPARDPYDEVYFQDTVFNGLTDMVVHLGRRTTERQPGWRFCCLLLPRDLALPLYQRRLFVYAQSNHGPHRIGLTTVLPHAPSLCISLRAFHSGRILYYPEISDQDVTIAHREIEGDVRSAIAVPVGGEEGEPLGILYVASNETHAFSASDQRLLKIVGKIAEEILVTYAIRRQITVRFLDVVKDPDIMDQAFSDFSSENDLFSAVKEILVSVKGAIEKGERHASEGASAAENKHYLDSYDRPTISLIAVDLDNQANLAQIYGYQATRNLSSAIGHRLQGQLRANFKEDSSLYHLYSDRYCLLFKNMALSEAQERAESLRNELGGSYRVSGQYLSAQQPLLPGSMLNLSHITVRLAMVSCSFDVLAQLLDIHDDVNSVRAVLLRLLEEGPG